MPIHVGTVIFTGLKMTLYLQRVPTVTVENALESVFETALEKYAQCFWTRLETHVGLDTWAHRNMGTLGKKLRCYINSGVEGDICVAGTFFT